jgi:acyl-CoA hydrolase
VTPQLSRLVRAGDLIVVPQGTAEPMALTRALVDQRSTLPRVRVLLGAVFSDVFEPAHGRSFEFLSFGGIGRVADLVAAGACEIVPCHFSQLPELMAGDRLRPDVAFLHLSAESVNGRHSVGIVDDYVGTAARRARVRIGQVNDQMPYTRGSATFALDELDAIVRVSEPLLEVRPSAPGPVAQQIAARAADLIGDGSCIQVGIGAVPDVVLGRLAARSGLGIHSGLLTDGLLDLHTSGAVTNQFKACDRGVSVGAAAFGTRRLYDALGQDGTWRVRAASYTHAQSTLADIPCFVALNSALQVDLTGQVNAEIAGGRYVGAVGGQVDFIRGAAASPGGRSLITVPATACNGTVSRIVVQLEGGVTTTARSDVDYVVTEYGVAELRHLPLRERARALAAIAAPQFRRSLLEQANAMNSTGLPGRSALSEDPALPDRAQAATA